jgi:hypothetical protein
MSYKRWPIKRSNAQRLLQSSGLAACLLVAGLGAASTPDKVSELQTRFDRESHATSKIKILDKLGEAQSAAATHAQQTNDYISIGLIFEKYRDNVRAAFEALKMQEPNADKHPEGYRRLELQVRRGIREVDDISIIVPEEVRPPLQLVREDLIKMDDDLIHDLFPPRTVIPAPPPPKEQKP